MIPGQFSQIELYQITTETQNLRTISANTPTNTVLIRNMSGSIDVSPSNLGGEAENGRPCGTKLPKSRGMALTPSNCITTGKGDPKLH